MAVSVFDLFKIGIGPSSSHTVGPMRAAARFASHWLDEKGELGRTARVRAEVFGSLALTGRGHGTDKAVLMGLEGHWPNLIDPDLIPDALERIRSTKRIQLFGRHEIAFDEKHDLIMNKRQKLPFHTNGMRFTAYDAAGEVIATRDNFLATVTHLMATSLIFSGLVQLMFTRFVADRLFEKKEHVVSPNVVSILLTTTVVTGALATLVAVFTYGAARWGLPSALFTAPEMGSWAY